MKEIENVILIVKGAGVANAAELKERSGAVSVGLVCDVDGCGWSANPAEAEGWSEASIGGKVFHVCHRHRVCGREEEEKKNVEKEKESTLTEKPVAEKLAGLNGVGQDIHDAISFHDGLLILQLQVGHPGEKNSRNGCFPTHLIDFCIELHQHYQTLIPSRETALVITKLEEARLWLEKRKMDREKRGVLQTDRR